MGFLGSVRQLWRAFDDDNSGVIGMEELDPEAKAALDQFYEWANGKFGCTLQCRRAPQPSDHVWTGWKAGVPWSETVLVTRPVA